MEQTYLEEAVFNFSQEGNCLNPSDAAEFLKIKCLSDLGIDRMGNCFYVLKTDGWSIDSAEELQKLFDRIHKTLFPKKLKQKQ